MASSAYQLTRYEQLQALPEGLTGEILNGQLYAQPRPSGPHGRVSVGLDRRIGRGYDEGDGGPGGWWIITEVSVAYEPHQCPSHDIAGWRKERMPERPRGVIELAPDWVCEIVSPGHERKDTLQLFLLLQRHRVPFYWLIWPEDRVLIAHQIDGEGYRVIKSISGQSRARIPPFEQIELDLAYVLGE